MTKKEKKTITVKGQSSPLSQMKKQVIFSITVIFAVIVGATILGIQVITYNSPKAPDVSPDLLADYQATMYTTPDCSCCHSYAEYLQDYSQVNLKVVKINYTELLKIKTAQGIEKAELRSCHTIIFNNFFVEGHVNLEAIEAFIQGGYINEARGLILPGMPAGSPGMGGFKTSYTVLLMTNSGETVNFISF